MVFVIILKGKGRGEHATSFNIREFQKLDEAIEFCDENLVNDKYWEWPIINYGFMDINLYDFIPNNHPDKFPI